MRPVTAYCAILFDDLGVQCSVGRRAALDVNYSNHGAGGARPLARSFHSQSIIAKPGDGRVHIDRRATVIAFVEADRWITNSSGNVGVQLKFYDRKVVICCLASNGVVERLVLVDCLKFERISIRALWHSLDRRRPPEMRFGSGARGRPTITSEDRGKPPWISFGLLLWEGASVVW
jgi:hypothetical protein